MKKITHYETMEFTYESRDERDNHVAELYLDGWRDSGRLKKLKDGVSIMNATKDDHEWYALFQRYIK
jgi:hypothetical protein